MNLKPNKHKIISFNTTTYQRSGGDGGGGRTFQKLSHFGLQNFLLEMGNKPVKRGRCRNGGGGGGATFLLLYSSVIFTVYEGKVRFPLLLFGSSVF